MTASPETIRLVQAAALVADEKGASNQVALDISEKTAFSDAFLIVSGRTERQVGSIFDAIEERLLELGAKAKRVEGKQLGRWVLLDYGEFVLHIFHEEDRTYYNLERLWADCPVIELELPVIAE